MASEYLEGLTSFPGGGPSLPGLGIGGGGAFDRTDNIKRAQAVAKQYGIPESIFLALINKESNFKTDAENPTSHASGLGQFLPSTAQEYGVSLEELRSNPQKALELSAQKLIKENKYLGGDWEKTVAAYLVGVGTVSEAVKNQTAAKDWRQIIAAKAKENGWDDPAKYVPAIMEGYRIDPRTLTEAQQRELVSGTKKDPSATTSGGYSDITKPPNPMDFYRDMGDGTRQLDTDALYKAMQIYQMSQASRKADREYNQGPLNQYVDDVIDQISKEIAVGNLDLSKANALLKARTDSYKMALDAFNGDSFKYGAPAGAQYRVGREPGSFAESVLGLAPKKADQGNFVDPLAEGRSIYDQALAGVGGVKTPSVPNIAGLRQDVMTNGIPGQRVQSPPFANQPTSGPPSSLFSNVTDMPVDQGPTDPRGIFDSVLARIRGAR